MCFIVELQQPYRCFKFTLAGLKYNQSLFNERVNQPAKNATGEPSFCEGSIVLGLSW